MNHLDEMTCLLYHDGQLDPGHAREVSAHLGECVECRALLGAIERESRWLHEALTEEDEPVPARLLDPRPVRSRLPWGWIAGLAFGAGGLYTLWGSLIEPLRTQLNQAGFGEGNLLTLLLFHGTFWKGWEIMRSLIEFLAISSVGIALFALLRRGWRRSTTVGVVLASLTLALGLPTPAGAAEVKKGDPDYTLAQGETVKNDLIFFGKTARIEGEVDGDVIAFGQRVEISGHVKGDVICWAQDLRVTGTVDGNIRAGANSIFLDGQVGKNVTLWMGNFEAASSSHINGGAIVGGGDEEFHGKLDRDLIVFGADITLNGFFGGDVLARSGRLKIDSAAVIQGAARYKGHHEPSVSSSAKLAKPLDVEVISTRPDYASVRYYWHQVLLLGAGFVFGLVILLLLPGFYNEAVRSTERFGQSLGFGALLLCATPILAIIACLTIIGLAVGITSVLLYLMSLYAGHIIMSSWVGEKLLGWQAGLGHAIARLALGLVVIRVLRMVPYVGGWVFFIATMWGLGALGVAAYRRREQAAVTA